MCPMCGSTTVILLGILGRVNHLRCRACGWTFSSTDDTLFDPDQDPRPWEEDR